jgi:hypothetical protein
MRKRSGAGLPSLRGGDVVRNTLHKKKRIENNRGKIQSRVENVKEAVPAGLQGVSGF